MANKWKSFLAIFSLCMMMTGCNDVIDLTDDQSNLIAEYAANLLLKYDRVYEDRIEDGMRELNKENATSEEALISEETTEITEEITSEEITTEMEQTVDETPSQEDKKETSDDANSVTEEDEAVTGGDDGTDEKITEYSVAEGDVARFAGIRDVSIKYKDYLITDQYPAVDEDGKFIYLEAAKGYELLVVRFAVTNNTDEGVNVSLLDSDIDYRIVCNNTKAAKPMLTILMNDLGTLESFVRPDEEQEAVLVFQISDSMKDNIESLELKVKYEGADNVIKIK